MNERDFFYWLQGFFEISETNKLNRKQVQIIKDHMKLVVDKQTPDRLDPFTVTDVTRWPPSTDTFCSTAPQTQVHMKAWPPAKPEDVEELDDDEVVDFFSQSAVPICGDEGCICEPGICKSSCAKCLSVVDVPTMLTC